MNGQQNIKFEQSSFIICTRSRYLGDKIMGEENSMHR
jgi:hypothetical protein